MSEASSWLAEAGDARRRQDWQALEHIYLTHLGAAGFVGHRQVAEAYRGLPLEARRERPVLTMAGALADNWELPVSEFAEAAAQRIAWDALNLHSQWRNLTDPDAVAMAGTFWMVVQRHTPSQPPSLALETAWATRGEVLARLAELRREARIPGNFHWASFCAAAGQLALATGDIATAVADSDLAIGADPAAEPADVARATKALALVLSGNDPVGAGARNRLGKEDLPGRGLNAEANAAWHLAHGMRAINRLDHQSVQAALAASETGVRGAAYWTGRAWLASTAAWLWQTPEAALQVLDDASFVHSLHGNEQDQPIGLLSLNRARAMALIRLGKPAAAQEFLDRIPTPWHWGTLALQRLWLGDFAEATRVAEAGLVDARTRQPGRILLAAVHRAVGLQENPKSAQRRLQAADAVARCVAAGQLLVLVMLPGELRSALLAAVEGEGLDVDPAAVATIRAAQPAEPHWTPVRLSRRERVLLPLLASPASVTEIAAQLDVSVHTVRTQVATLRGKFAARTRDELVRRSREAGLLN